MSKDKYIIDSVDKSSPSSTRTGYQLTHSNVLTNNPLSAQKTFTTLKISIMVVYRSF